MEAQRAFLADQNPFRVSQIESIPFQFIDDSWEDFLERLEEACFRGAIVGPHGSGKTTLLIELAEKLKARGEVPALIRLTEERFTIEYFPNSPTVLLLDGAEQLSEYSWRLLMGMTRLRERVVITSHQEGRLPTLYRSRTDLLLVQNITDQLIGTGAVQVTELRELMTKHHGNIREVYRELYWRAAAGRNPQSLPIAASA